LPIVDCQLPIGRNREVSNQSAIGNARRGAGVVELAALEML
jgi:hypothetical protein